MMQFRSLAWSDYFLYSITDFRELYRRVRQDGAVASWFSFLVPFLVALTSVVSASLMAIDDPIFMDRIKYGIAFSFFSEVLQVMVYSSLIDSLAQLQGFKGNVKEVVTVYNFAMFPRVFILPIAFFFSTVGFGAGFFYVVGTIALFAWYVINFIQGLSEMHSIELGRALGLFLIPSIIIVLVGFLLLVLGGLMLSGYLGSVASM